MPENAKPSMLAFFRASENRGLLLDAFVFLINLTGMGYLSTLFLDSIHRANAGDKGAAYLLFSMAIAMFCLAPLGATLKRWSFHQSVDKESAKEFSEELGGCLFNPIFYFCLTAVIFASINAFILQTVYGKEEPDGGVFVSSIFLGIGLMIAHTVLVYRYFSAPKKPPRMAFLKSPVSAFLGDACIFANMTLFQLIWNLMGTVDWPRPSGFWDFIFRFLMLLFLALLLYFPPRMFYLAGETNKWHTWATILLANSPILVRLMLGVG